MLYVISRQNHPELTFQGGQDSIIHLEADLHATVAYASGVPLRWAFTLSNAGARYVEFRSNLANLDEIDWVAVEARQWAAPPVKEGKQAEFLIHGRFPWTLVSRIGVRSAAMKASVETALQASTHRPVVEVRDDWYYL